MADDNKPEPGTSGPNKAAPSDDRPFREKVRDSRSRKDADLTAALNKAATLIKFVFSVLALLLAVGALLVALRENIHETNPVVKFVLNLDDAIDGPFSRTDGIFTFTGKSAETKDALANWGIAAIVYLVIGRLLARLVRR